jgi:hypothetical protein
MGKGLKWTEEEQRRLLQLRAAGKSIVEIAELLKKRRCRSESPCLGGVGFRESLRAVCGGARQNCAA